MATYKKLSSALHQLSLDVFESAELLAAAADLNIGENVNTLIGARFDRHCVTVGRNDNGRYYAVYVN